MVHTKRRQENLAPSRARRRGVADFVVPTEGISRGLTWAHG